MDATGRRRRRCKELLDGIKEKGELENERRSSRMHFMKNSLW